MKSVLNYTATVLGCDIVRRITALSMLPKWQLQQLMENDKKQLNDRLLAEEPGPVPQPEPKPSMQCAWCGAPPVTAKSIAADDAEGSRPWTYFSARYSLRPLPVCSG